MKYISLLLALFFLFSCAKKEPEEIDPFIYKSGSMKQGQTLAEALKQKDIKNTDVYKLVNKLDEIYNLRRSHPGDSFKVKLDSLDVIHELSYFPDKIKTYRVLRDTTDLYFTKIDTLPVIKVIKKCDGVIISSLYQAMIDQDEGPALAMALSEIFQWDIDFNIDPQKGDEFHLVYEQFMSEGEFVKYDEILVAQYVSGKYNNIAYRYENNKGTIKYYNEKGESFQKAFLKSPLNYKRISSYFGKRFHPIKKKVWMHNGVDYAAAYGTPVESSADGTIIHRGWKGGHPTVKGRKGGYGKTIMIRHANSYKTLYGHLSKYGKYKVGDRVEQHDIIGYVGSTGLSTGNHLHYTIYHHGTAINPLKLKNVSGPPVPKDEMENFKVVADSLKTLLFSADSQSKQIFSN